MFLQTLKNRNEKTTNNKKIERNVKNMTTYALVDTKDINDVKKWEILDKVEIDKADLMDCIKIQKWYEDITPNINPVNNPGDILRSLIVYIIWSKQLINPQTIIPTPKNNNLSPPK